VERLAGRRELAPDEVGDLIDRIDAERAGRALVSGLTMLPATDRAGCRAPGRSRTRPCRSCPG
jgi:hypothetical protein